MRSLGSRLAAAMFVGSAASMLLVASALYLATPSTASQLAPTFWPAAIGASLLAGGWSMWRVRVELAGLRGLGRQLETPEAALAELDHEALPTELLPLVTRSNRLLERARAALDREREFTGHVAHELRTPLAVLRTGLDLAMRKTAGQGERVAEAHGHLEELSQTVDEMTKMVSNLLTLARVERGAEATQIEPVRLHSLVESAWRRFASKAAKRELAFENRVAEDAMAQADPGKLSLVVQNLLSNAVSYTERGGSIAIEAPPGEVLSVWDSGPQLDEETRDKIFDRLWRADAARTDATEHAGIGLSLSRALCRHMRMRLSAENAPEGGLRFVVTREG